MKRLLTLGVLGLSIELISYLIGKSSHQVEKWRVDSYGGPFSELRRTFLDQLHGVSSNADALVAGLAIGDTSMLSTEFKEQMKTVSLTHLTAVSGANCAIVIGLIYLVLSQFPVNRTLKISISLSALILYILLVGPQASVLRAGVMTAVVLIAAGFGRGVESSLALAFSATALLLINPWLANDYGFQLSVLATFGILELAPSLTRRFNQRLPTWLSLALAISISAQLVCMPVLLQLQPGLSTYSIPANILVEPLVAPITVLGILACLITPLAPWLTTFLAWIASFCAQFIVASVSWLSGLPNATLGWLTGTAGLLIASVFVAATFLWLRSNRETVRLVSLVFMSIVIAVTIGGCSAQSIRGLSWPQSDWTVISCDVGQGDATVIRSLGFVAVIDAGRKPGPVNSCLQQLHVDRIDLLVLTHYDMDHVGGLDGVLNHRSVFRALITGFRDPRPSAQTIYNQLRKAATEVSNAETGMHGFLGNYRWQVLSPHHGAPEAEDSNDGSVTMLFRSNELNILTLADLGERGQMRLAAESANWLGNGLGPAPLVVKVSHHGSSDQYSELYEALRPDVALVSVGANNDYGHPTARALSMLARAGARTFRTDREGSIAVSVTNRRLQVQVVLNGG